MGSFDYVAIPPGLGTEDTDDGNYIALGGDDRRCAVGTFDLPASTSDIVVSGLDFQPECLVIFGAVITLDTGADGLFLHYGVATSPTDQWAMSVMAADNTGGQPRWGAFKSGRIIYQVSSGALDFEMSLQSFNADGFTLNVEDAPGGDVPVFYCAMAGGGSYACGVADSPTVTPASQTIDAGFVADCVLFGSTGRTSDPEISDHMVLCLGAADADSQNNDCISGDAGSVFCTTRQDTGFCLAVARTDGAGGAIHAQASLVDLDNAGEFELDWTTVDVVAYKFGWLALQEADTGRFLVDDDATEDNPVTVPVAVEDLRGLLGFCSSIHDAAAPGEGPGAKDANGWLEGASIGVCAVNEEADVEHSVSVQDLSSPPFGVIQTKRDHRPWAFSCFRTVGSGSLIVGTDSRSVHPIDIMFGWLPQIYRRVVQRYANR